MAIITSRARVLRGLAAAAVCMAALGAAREAAAAPAYGLTSAGQIFSSIPTSLAPPRRPSPSPACRRVRRRWASTCARPPASSSCSAAPAALYVVSPLTGAATAVGGPFTPALSGTVFGFDFNPTVDRIRVVSDTGQNLRLNPDTGAVATADGAINPGTPRIVGSAYTNNCRRRDDDDALRHRRDDGHAAHPESTEQRHAGAGGRARRRHDRPRRLRHQRPRQRRLRVADVGGQRLEPLSRQPDDRRRDARRRHRRRAAGRPDRRCPRCADGRLARRRSGPFPQRLAVHDPGHRHHHRPAAGETIVGIDVRPADGRLYGVGSVQPPLPHRPR